MAQHIRELMTPNPVSMPGTASVHEAARAMRRCYEQEFSQQVPVKRRIPMARCETCGHNYDKAFEVVMAGTSHRFDRFECAIQALAPTCGHCGCRILGHGVEADGDIYCCAHCAGQAGVQGIQDRSN